MPPPRLRALRRLMETTDFDFDLPDDHIALGPRSLAIPLAPTVRQDGLEDRIIRDLPDFLRHGDGLCHAKPFAVDPPAGAVRLSGPR